MATSLSLGQRAASDSMAAATARCVSSSSWEKDPRLPATLTETPSASADSAYCNALSG